jgi:hypothetical protein
VLALAAVALVWSYVAQWTTFDCAGDVCVFERRRLLTFPTLTRHVTSRKVLGDHPEQLELRVVDQNRGTSEIDLRLEPGQGDGLVYQGWRAETAAKLEELRRATRSGGAAVHESVTPNPFGFLVLFVVVPALFVLIGARLYRLRRTT